MGILCYLLPHKWQVQWHPMLVRHQRQCKRCGAVEIINAEMAKAILKAGRSVIA